MAPSTDTSARSSAAFRIMASSSSSRDLRRAPGKCPLRENMRFDAPRDCGQQQWFVRALPFCMQTFHMDIDIQLKKCVRKQRKSCVVFSTLKQLGKLSGRERRGDTIFKRDFLYLPPGLDSSSRTASSKPGKGTAQAFLVEASARAPDALRQWVHLPSRMGYSTL